MSKPISSKSLLVCILLKETNTKTRDQTRVVTYRCPFNSIMQIYNLKEKTSRIVFGPNLVMLEPYESFSVNSLSGATPKKSGVVETLYLKLGPIFSTDEFDVETVDHTRLKLRIAYNWKFDLKKDVQVMGNHTAVTVSSKFIFYIIFIFLKFKICMVTLN